MALDDFSFTDCGYPDLSSPCQRDEFTCDNKRCIPSGRICDLTDHCGDQSDEKNCDTYLTCTFEQGICDWEQLHTDELDWNLEQGLTRTPWTGPAHDHTTWTELGTYLYLESSSPRQYGDRAQLASAPLAKSTKDCQLRFYYLLYGATIGTLSVYTRTEVNGPLTIRWHHTGEFGDYYLRIDVELDSDRPFQVILEATVGDGSYGDIAIDDTSFTPECTRYHGALPVATTLTPATATTHRPCQVEDFVCGVGGCIDNALRCDGRNDCVDASDELNCGQPTVTPRGTIIMPTEAATGPMSTLPVTGNTKPVVIAVVTVMALLLVSVVCILVLGYYRRTNKSPKLDSNYDDLSIHPDPVYHSRPSETPMTSVSVTYV